MTVKKMKSKICLLGILLSALVFHDFFKIEFFKLGPLTLTYQRIVIIVLCPIIFLPKFKINLKDRLFVGILIFFIYGLGRIGGNYREFITIYFPFFTFLLIYILISKNSEIKLVINFVATIYIFFCFIGLIEIISGLHFVETYLEENTKLLAVGMYYNQNDFSAFLLTMIFYMFLSNYPMIIKLFTTLIAMYIIYMNGSQICILALLTFAILYLIFRIENKKTRLFFLFVSIFGVFFMKDVFIHVIQKSSFVWRLLMYETGIQVCKNNLFFGTGIGNYEVAMYSLGFVESHSMSASPHCLLLELAGQFGGIWSILFISLLIHLFLFVCKSKLKNKIFLLGMLYIYPFISIASSSSLDKNFTYLALLIPLLFYKRKRMYR